jgi:hypothetical protein
MILFHGFQFEKNDHYRTWGANWSRKFGHRRTSRSGSEETERENVSSPPVREKRPRPDLGDELVTKVRSLAHFLLRKSRKGTRDCFLASSPRKTAMTELEWRFGYKSSVMGVFLGLEAVGKPLVPFPRF